MARVVFPPGAPPPLWTHYNPISSKEFGGEPYEGKQLGRPPIPEALEERIREARKGGLSVRKAAAKFGVSPGTVQRIPFAHVAGASAAAG